MVEGIINHAKLALLCQIDYVGDATAEKFYLAGIETVEGVAEIETSRSALKEFSNKSGIRSSQLKKIIPAAKKLLEQKNKDTGVDLSEDAPDTHSVEEKDQPDSSEESDSGAPEDAPSEDIKDPLSDIFQEAAEDREILRSVGLDSLEQVAAMSITKVTKQTRISKKTLRAYKKDAQTQLDKQPLTDEDKQELRDLEMGMKINNTKIDMALGIEPDPETLDEIAQVAFDENRMVNPDDGSGSVTEPNPERSGSVTELSGSVTELKDDGTEPNEYFLVLPETQLFIAKQNPRIRDIEYNLEDWPIFESIKKDGVQEPVIVFPVGEKYAVLNGGTRLDCARRLGIPKVPCIVKTNLSPEERFRLAFTLNDTQKPFTHLERANNVLNLKTELKLANSDLGKFMGLKKVQVGKYIAVHRNPPEVLTALHRGEIGLEAACEISKVAFEVEFKTNGLWAFNWDDEPETWREERLEHQKSLLMGLMNSGMSLSQLRVRVTEIIQQEKERREAVAKAEKEAAEKAAQERTERDQKRTRLQTEIELEQDRLKNVVQGYIDMCAKFEEKTGIELGTIGLKDPEDFEKITKQGYMDFEAVFGPLTPPSTAVLTTCLNLLKAFSQEDVFTFNDEQYCAHCGSTVSNTDSRAALIEAVEKHIQEVKDSRKSLEETRKELFSQTQLIRSHFNTKNRLETELKNLEAGQATTTEAVCFVCNKAIGEKDSTILTGGKVAHGSCYDVFEDSKLFCDVCHLQIAPKTQQFQTVTALESGVEVTRYIHKSCLQEGNHAVLSEKDVLVARELTEDVLAKECGICAGPLANEPQFVNLPSGSYAHISCAEKQGFVIDSESLICADCGQPITEDQAKDKYAAGPKEGRYFHTTCPKPTKLCIGCGKPIEDEDDMGSWVITKDGSARTYYGHNSCADIIESEDFDPRATSWMNQAVESDN